MTFFGDLHLLYDMQKSALLGWKGKANTLKTQKTQKMIHAFLLIVLNQTLKRNTKPFATKPKKTLNTNGTPSLIIKNI